MSDINHAAKVGPPKAFRQVTTEVSWVRYTLITVVVALLALLLFAPLITVFVEALNKGAATAVASLANPEATSAIRLTLMVAAFAVPINAVFGVAAAWLITKFTFKGKAILITMIDIPFSVSPVVAGLCIVLTFGANSWVGGWLVAHGMPVVFAVPGIIMASMFVTFPFVARELIPVLEANGPEEELAARSLGASGWQMFTRITLPNVKWGLLYGVILCNARAMGEFGAIAVVSGRIAGKTDTMPLRVEKLFQESNNPAAMAVASLLTMVALGTLLLKVVVERQMRAQKALSAEVSP